MTDKMDELLFGIGGEENARLDLDAMYASFLAEKQRRGRTRRRNARMLSAAAVFAAVIGVSTVLLPSPALYGMKGAPPEACNQESACDMDMRSCAPSDSEAAASAELPPPCPSDAGEGAEPAAPEESAAPAGDAGKGSGADACFLSDFTRTPDRPVCIGAAGDNFKAELEEAGFSVTETSCGEAPEEGYARIIGGRALWNTGLGTYLINGPRISSADEMADALKAVCRTD